MTKLYSSHPVILANLQFLLLFYDMLVLRMS